MENYTLCPLLSFYAMLGTEGMGTGSHRGMLREEGGCGDGGEFLRPGGSGKDVLLQRLSSWENSELGHQGS